MPFGSVYCVLTYVEKRRNNKTFQLDRSFFPSFFIFCHIDNCIIDCVEKIEFFNQLYKSIWTDSFLLKITSTILLLKIPIKCYHHELLFTLNLPGMSFGFQQVTQDLPEKTNEMFSLFNLNVTFSDNFLVFLVILRSKLSE